VAVIEQVGLATLHLGDCRDILPTLPKVDAVVTDPPFVGLAGGVDSAHSNAGAVENASVSVGDPWEASHDWLPLAWATCERALMTFCTYHSAADVQRAVGETPCGILMWEKPNAPHPARNVPRANAELIWLFRKGSGLNWRALGSSVIRMNMLMSGCMADAERILEAGSGKALHPTQKPIALMKRLLKVDPTSVCDPFMGTGTTGVAAAQMGIPFIGIERDERYFDIACKRIEDAQRQGDLFI
jgi:site-specific DNA-methyltransferase (adenine-specific)/modification methylase